MMISTTNALGFLRDKILDVLALDLDDFGIAFVDEELVSNYLGLTLRSEFQEIRELSGNRVHGYEALLKVADSEGRVDVSAAFQRAGEEGRLIPLDRVARTLHALNYRHAVPHGGLLFLKVHPRFLVSVTKHGRVFEKILHAYSIPTNRMVIELQGVNVAREVELYEALMNYRERGYKVAIDDSSLEYSSLERLLGIAPEYVRLHSHLVHGARKNGQLLRIFQGMVALIRELGAKSIIDGIENEALLGIALESGASLGQGAFLGEPHSARFLRSSQN
jgi:EAL domain-containing protein (putative c-di-GMP-specific phosphodiesterase class I)